MVIDRSVSRNASPPSMGRCTEHQQPVVIILDDDASVREALSELMQSAGLAAISPLFARPSSAALVSEDD